MGVVCMSLTRRKKHKVVYSETRKNNFAIISSRDMIDFVVLKIPRKCTIEMTRNVEKKNLSQKIRNVLTRMQNQFSGCCWN